MKRAQAFRRTCFCLIASLFILSSASHTYGQQKGQPCPDTFDAALDDFNRPTRLALVNSDKCVKETTHFSSAPVETHTFPFNGQTFTTQDGVTITQMFSRSHDFDHSFTYTMGASDLIISVHRVAPKAAGPKKIKLLPVEISIRFNDEAASFTFTGRESEAELADKLKEFFAVGRAAGEAGFDPASDRMAAFAKKVWNSFAGGDAKRSKLPLKASFPVTEMTANIFALSFALQNQAFFRNKLCSIPKNFRQSLLVISGIKEKTNSNSNDQAKRVKASTGNTQEDEIGGDYEEVLDEAAARPRLCCWACEVTHCLLDVHWADPICCFGRCYMPWVEKKEEAPKTKTGAAGGLK